MDALIARRVEVKTALDSERDLQKRSFLQETFMSISDEIEREKDALLAAQADIIADLGEQLTEAKISGNNVGIQLKLCVYFYLRALLN